MDQREAPGAMARDADEIRQACLGQASRGYYPRQTFSKFWSRYGLRRSKPARVCGCVWKLCLLTLSSRAGAPILTRLCGKIIWQRSSPSLMKLKAGRRGHQRALPYADVPGFLSNSARSIQLAPMRSNFSFSTRSAPAKLSWRAGLRSISMTGLVKFLRRDED